MLKVLNIKHENPSYHRLIYAALRLQVRYQNYQIKFTNYQESKGNVSIKYNIQETKKTEETLAEYYEFFEEYNTTEEEEYFRIIADSITNKILTNYDTEKDVVTYYGHLGHKAIEETLTVTVLE